MTDLFKLLTRMTLAIPTAIVGFFIYVILLLVGKFYEGPAKPKLSLTMLLTVSDGTTYKGNHMSLIIRNDQEIYLSIRPLACRHRDDILSCINSRRCTF